MNAGKRLVRLEAGIAGFPFVVIADGNAVLRSVLRPGEKELLELRGVPEGDNSVTEAALKFIDRYLRGEDGVLPPLDFGGCTAAERMVYTACSRIPFGDRMSYGMLALAAGFPRAARFAGSCMRRNRHMLFVPCHRVVPAGGGIGQYSGGEDVKKELLEFEAGFPE